MASNNRSEYDYMFHDLKEELWTIKELQELREELEHLSLRQRSTSISTHPPDDEVIIIEDDSPLPSQHSAEELLQEHRDMDDELPQPGPSMLSITPPITPTMETSKPGPSGSPQPGPSTSSQLGPSISPQPGTSMSSASLPPPIPEEKRVQVLEDIQVAQPLMDNVDDRDFNIYIADNDGGSEIIRVSYAQLSRAKKRKQRFRTADGTRLNVRLLANGYIRVIPLDTDK